MSPDINSRKCKITVLTRKVCTSDERNHMYFWVPNIVKFSFTKHTINWFSKQFFDYCHMWMQFWCCGLFFCFAPANAFAPTALMHGLEDVQLCTNARVEKMWNWWVIFSPQACALTSMQAQGTNYTRNQPEIRGVRESLNTTGELQLLDIDNQCEVSSWSSTGKFIAEGNTHLQSMTKFSTNKYGNIQSWGRWVYSTPAFASCLCVLFNNGLACICLPCPL